MSAPTVLPHVDAVQAALAAAELTVYVGGAPPTTASLDKYAVIYPDSGRGAASSLTDDRSDFAALMQITCVGTTPERALWVADRVRAALSGPLVVADRSGWRPEELGGPPLQRDDDITPPLYYLPVQYRVRSTPA